MRTVAQLLNGKSAVICADVRIAGLPLKARGSVFLSSDPFRQIIGAIIESGDGGRLLYRDEAALNLLYDISEWMVFFSPDIEQAMNDYLRRLGVVSVGNRQESGKAGGPPLRRLQPLPETILDVLSLKDRLVIKTVFSMIDDRRSLDELKKLLKLPPETVEEAVESLREFRVVE